MSKKKFQKYLKELKAQFKNDNDLLAAISKLNTAVDSLADEVSSDNKKLEFPKGIQGYAPFSDGACRGNPGPGAWASLGMNENHHILFQDSGYFEHTSNNKMELLGAMNALKLLLKFDPYAQDKEIHLFSDSKYVTNGISEWVPMWKSRGWKKADNKAPENLDLWMEFSELVEKFKKLKFHWVKGHSGHTQNDYVDQMCNDILDEFTGA